MSLRPDDIRNIALEGGFDLVAFGPADPGEDAARFLSWLEAGRAGEMDWLRRNRELIADPQKLAPGVRSSISLAQDYGGPARDIDGARIARYAAGRDYHRSLGKASRRIREALEQAGLPRGSMRTGPDAIPILERALAARAGIGFLAKSAGIISPEKGPYLLLSEVLTPQELPFDLPAPGSCGSCRACLDACPTGALTAPHELDARICLSYTTIEKRGFIPEALRRAQADWLFGCDICLEVCPFTSKGRAAASSLRTRPPDLQAHRVVETYDLIGILELSQVEWDRDWVGTAMRRATRSGLRRNAAIALGNLGREDATPALEAALGDEDPVVRGHAAWALGELGSGRRALEQQRGRERDPAVLAELDAALQR